MSNDDKDIKPRNDNASDVDDAQEQTAQGQSAGADTGSDASAAPASEGSASAESAAPEASGEGIDEDVNDDIAQAEAESADGKGDVNEYGIDALDISFDTEVDFDALDALGADAIDGEGADETTGITGEVGEDGIASNAAEAAISPVSDGAARDGGQPDADAAPAKDTDADGAAKDTESQNAAGESQEADNDESAESAADADAAPATDESADAQPEAAAKPAIAPKASTESIVSSRIDAEVRRRRGIVAPDRYPVYELADVSVARAKTGKAIIEHVDCAFFNGYVNAILVDSDEERQAVMALLAGLALPTSGTVRFRSKPLYEYEMHEYRGHEVGLVFQRFNLRPDLTVLRNIVLAMDASGRNFLKAKDALAKERLAQAGFPEDRADVPVRELDAFELRRAEIARALCCEANMLILDEPTGGLTDAEADQVFATLERFVRRDDRCVIIVTGRESVADRCASAYAVNETAPEDTDAADGVAADEADAAANDETANDEADGGADDADDAKVGANAD